MFRIQAGSLGNLVFIWIQIKVFDCMLIFVYLVIVVKSFSRILDLNSNMPGGDLINMILNQNEELLFSVYNFCSSLIIGSGLVFLAD